MTIANKAAPRMMKMMAQSGACRMSEAIPIPFCIKYRDVGGKKGPSSEHTVFCAITRINCKKNQHVDILVVQYFSITNIS